MNERKFETMIEGKIERHHRNRGRGQVWAGAFILIVGLLLLARASDIFFFPRWLFTWPMILVAIGLFSGIRHGFRGIGWMIPLLIGAIFLLQTIYAHDPIRNYIWPMAVIIIGLLIIFRPKDRYRKRGPEVFADESTDDPVNRAEWEKAIADKNDVVDITAIFGGVKKKVLSKTFKGGDIVAFMGGTEVDLTQADFEGKVMIDSFNMFGGTKLLVPPDWDVQSDIVAIFGGVDDKRPPAKLAEPRKVLYLDGTCLFGGVEIRSY